MQHLDEGTIHAWLDGQLPPDEARTVEEHVAACRPCADAVAEARGLIAASSRILMSLDSVPRDVVPLPSTRRSDAERGAETPATPVVAPRSSSQAEQRAQRRWFRGPSLAAAAVVVMAVGTFALMRASGPDMRALSETEASSPASGPIADSAVPSSAGASGRAVMPPVAPSPAAPPPQSLGAAGTAAGQSRVASAPADIRTLRDAARLESSEKVADAKRESAPAPQRAAAPGAPPPPSAKASPDDRAKDGFVAPAELRRQSLAKQDSVARDELKKAPPPAPVLAAEKPRGDSSAIVIRGAKTVSPPAMGSAIARVQPSNANSARADSAKVSAATGIVRGRITDANNTGLEGAMVRVAGTETGVSTNATGEFTLGGLAPGVRRLTVRRIGYDTVGRDVTVVAGQSTNADIVLTPSSVALSEVVTTGTAAARKRTAAATSDAPPGAPITAAQSNAVGCYELGITPTAAQARTGFRQVPRRIALDSEIVPANADGVWYRARDLARVGTLPNGLWRPAGPDAVELEWSYGTRTDRVRLSGPPGSMMRGSIEEIDRATAMGEAGTVVAVRRPCEGG
jgi:anti-sigma factor RsiW